jgi:hypothetical protein
LDDDGQQHHQQLAHGRRLARQVTPRRVFPVNAWNVARVAVDGGNAVISSNVKIAAAGASLDVPLGHTDDSWSFPHFDTITVSVADAPRPNEILVVMAIDDGGRLWNRCGTEPIR